MDNCILILIAKEAPREEQCVCCGDVMSPDHQCTEEEEDDEEGTFSNAAKKRKKKKYFDWLHWFQHTRTNHKKHYFLSARVWWLGVLGFGGFPPKLIRVGRQPQALSDS